MTTEHEPGPGDVRGVIRTRPLIPIVLAMTPGVVLGLALSPSSRGVLSLDETAAMAAEDWLRPSGGPCLDPIQMDVIPPITTSLILGGRSDVPTQGWSPDRSLRRGSTPAIPIGIASATIVQPRAFVDPASIASTSAPRRPTWR